MDVGVVRVVGTEPGVGGERGIGAPAHAGTAAHAIVRAIEAFEDTVAKLRNRAPDMSQRERFELARALVRAKGLLPPAPQRR